MAARIRQGIARNRDKHQGKVTIKNYTQKRVDSNLARKKVDVSAILN